MKKVKQLTNILIVFIALVLCLYTASDAFAIIVPPTVITKPMPATIYQTVVTTAIVTLNGEITSNGGAPITDHGFYWGTSSTNLYNKESLGPKVGIGLFNKAITIRNITASDTTIYYKAYATNSAGTSYGATLSFLISITMPTYTVTYNANGGLGAPYPQVKMHNVTLILSNIKPIKPSYDFIGWATTETATIGQYQPGGSYTENVSTTLYAVWRETNTSPPIVRISPNPITLAIGETQQLNATVFGVLKETETWISNNSTVATVSTTGLVTAIAEGNAMVTVIINSGSMFDECPVTVNSVPPPPEPVIEDTDGNNNSNNGNNISGSSSGGGCNVYAYLVFTLLGVVPFVIRKRNKQ